MDNSYQRLEQFFSPRHIVVVGASTKNFWFANAVMNASTLGFEGAFYPVNPTAQEVAGIKAYKGIETLPDAPFDFGVVMVKASLVKDTIGRLLSIGIKNILLLTSGYAETGPQGKALQLELTQFCKENDILLMGPNCLGFINPLSRSSVFVGGSVEGIPAPGGIGVIAQSGATSEILVSKLIGKGLGISIYSTTGNEAVLTAEDILEYLVNDASTKIITAFFEGFRDIAKLKAAAKTAASRAIPIIMVKVGRSSHGVNMASSHTGALAGNDAVIDSALRQFGIIRVDSIEEMVETASLFSRCRLPDGDGLCIYTLSGGLCGMYADLCEKYGISLPELSNSTKEKLKEILPEFAQPDNPLDVTGSGFQSGLDSVFDILLEEESISIIAPLCISPPGPDDIFSPRINSAFLRYSGSLIKTVVPIAFREVNSYARELFKNLNLHVMEHPDIGFKALSHFINYAKYVRRP
ncbi:MAG TPA: CoA-binding protein [Desulfomonilia bacterium]